MSEFVKALLECREDSKIPEQYDWFAPLLGDWEFDYYDVKNGKRERHVKGECKVNSSQIIFVPSKIALCRNAMEIVWWGKSKSFAM